ncbi:MAG TPA: UDP-N-acetylenolpyruvoylglucosamine reductase [Ruminococcaceae bacterium]|nr:UDP-N-acetylenolpyruvoylglucosamine reductase [Oscillospiraceae bacterium]
MDEFKAFCISLGCKAYLNEPMSRHTSFKIGGNADYLIYPNSLKTLKAVLDYAKQKGIKTYFIGRGSNLLVSDKGVRGAVICLDEFCEINLEDENTIVCSAGIALSRLSYFAYRNSLSGLEFAWGIPGSVGGAVYMNAGAYGGEIKDVIEKTCHLTETLLEGEFTKNELKLSYRQSVYSKVPYCITYAQFKLCKDEKKAIKARMDDYLARRKQKQPLEYPSAGSTFKRPLNAYASQLIDECGLKGRTVGGAMVSDKHAGFVINYNNATCSDVLSLVDIIKTEVKQKKGKSLECEIKLLGEF